VEKRRVGRRARDLAPAGRRLPLRKDPVKWGIVVAEHGGLV
jgi:hypothetical protein